MRCQWSQKVAMFSAEIQLQLSCVFTDPILSSARRLPRPPYPYRSSLLFAAVYSQPLLHHIIP